MKDQNPHGNTRVWQVLAHAITSGDISGYGPRYSENRYVLGYCESCECTDVRREAYGRGDALCLRRQTVGIMISGMKIHAKTLAQANLKSKTLYGVYCHERWPIEWPLRASPSCSLPGYYIGLMSIHGMLGDMYHLRPLCGLMTPYTLYWKLYMGFYSSTNTRGWFRSSSNGQEVPLQSWERHVKHAHNTIRPSSSSCRVGSWHKIESWGRRGWKRWDDPRMGYIKTLADQGVSIDRNTCFHLSRRLFFPFSPFFLKISNLGLFRRDWV